MGDQCTSRILYEVGFLTQTRLDEVNVHWLEVQHIEGYPVVFKPVLESNLKNSNPIKINLECLFIYLFIYNLLH